MWADCFSVITTVAGVWQIVALCDCNPPRAEKFKADKQATWAVYQDYRELLDRKDIDAVIVATGEFQRVLPCIHACQAGKDVYAEKPLTLYVREGRVLVEAARKYDRVFQVGSQQRSMAMNRIACELIRSGGLGKIREVRAMNYSVPRIPRCSRFPKSPYRQVWIGICGSIRPRIGLTTDNGWDGCGGEISRVVK